MSQDDLTTSALGRFVRVGGLVGRVGISVLGEMKGAAMKVDQMLGLHEGFLPPEVSAVLSVLQKEAPSVSFSVME